MKNARQTAFEILCRMEEDNSYSNITVDSNLKEAGLDTRDSAFVSAIVYGVTEKKITIDYQIALYLSKPIKKLNVNVITTLRLGAYQILFMDKVPVSAAVNESVKIVKSNGSSYASGFVNAVLRKIAANGICLPEDKNCSKYFSIKYSCPEWLYSMWKNDYSQDISIKLMESISGSSETFIRVNTLLTTTEELKNILSEEGVSSDFCKLDKNALVIRHQGNITKLKSFKNGLFHVQDISSQLCCKALDAKKDDVVYDICAAPGGKSLTTAQYMCDSGEIDAFDIYNSRLQLISSSAKRLHIHNIITKVNDGSKYNCLIKKANKILCDVPCSGIGVIRKKPEIMYKNPSDIDKLPILQYSILCASSQYLNSSGRLIYSTCSLNPKENEEVVKKFIAEHEDFYLEKVLPEVDRYADDTLWLTLMPHVHGSDGFFISSIRKK